MWRVLQASIFTLVLSISGLCADNKTPLWKIDLSTFNYKPADNVVLKFTGHFLVIYLGRGNPLRVVFDTVTHQQIPEHRLSGIDLPPPMDFEARFDRKPFPAVNVIGRWKQMAIEEVGGVGIGQVPDGEYYLEEPGKPKVLLDRGHPRCNPGDPEFVGSSYILIFPCHGKNVVVDAQGHQLYQLKQLSGPYVTLNLGGTRFVTYERLESFWHSIEGTTNKLRVRVFRSLDGKNLFDYRWNVTPDEGTSDGRVALSDDGLLVALVRGHEVLILALPALFR